MLTPREAADLLKFLEFAWKNGAIRSPEDAQAAIAIQVKLAAIVKET